MHKAVVIVIVNCAKGRDLEMQEAVAKGTDAHKMRTGAFGSKCRVVTRREPRKGDRETGLLLQAPAPPGHLTLELHGSTRKGGSRSKGFPICCRDVPFCIAF